MGSPLFRLASGTQDGFNRTFDAPFSIEAGGILAAMLNGGDVGDAVVHNGGTSFTLPVTTPAPEVGDQIGILALVEGETVTTPIIETLVPEPNGANLIFSTSVAYQSGSIILLLEGQWGGAGIASADPGGASVTLTTARVPLAGEQLRAYFLPSSGPPPPSVGGQVIEVDVQISRAVDATVSIPQDIDVAVSDPPVLDVGVDEGEDIEVDVDVPIAVSVDVEDC